MLSIYFNFQEAIHYYSVNIIFIDTNNYFFQVKTVVFDKTGTLTHGKPVVTKTNIYVPNNVCSVRKFLAIIGTAESGSEHPIGLAITNYTKKMLNKFVGLCTDFEAQPGYGLKCVVSKINEFVDQMEDIKEYDTVNNYIEGVHFYNLLFFNYFSLLLLPFFNPWLC